MNVTLTSDDPGRLLLSTSQTAVGSRSITIVIPPAGYSARYYLQALGDSGTVTYTATAKGFRSRTGMVSFAPSGIVLTPIWQGPPDEAHVLRDQPPESNYKFSVSLSKSTPMKLVVWTAQLDPVTHRSADITVQPLRAGRSLTIPMTNSNPAVGKTAANVTIPGGSDHVIADFTAMREGSTEISVMTPKDFTPSANSTTVIGLVHK